MNRQQATQIVTESLEELLANDRILLVNDVSERAITHKLAEYLQRRVNNLNLRDIHVDCEYNRNSLAGDGAPKTVRLVQQRVQAALEGQNVVTDDRYRSVTTFPDIIVHERGTNDHNLLVIEVKKINNQVDPGLDFAKLGAFTEDTEHNSYRYRHGLFIQLTTGMQDLPFPQLTWFSIGRREGAERAASQ